MSNLILQNFPYVYQIPSEIELFSILTTFNTHCVLWSLLQAIGFLSFFCIKLWPKIGWVCLKWTNESLSLSSTSSFLLVCLVCVCPCQASSADLAQSYLDVDGVRNLVFKMFSLNLWQKVLITHCAHIQVLHMQPSKVDLLCPFFNQP